MACSNVGRNWRLSTSSRIQTSPGAVTRSGGRTFEELLNAGIDVYTTMNIQHLESLNNVVAKISRVNVRETVPDHVVDRADQIAVIDLPAEDLIQRLHEGKVYVPETAQLALQHFFSPGNLTALRELLLRSAAERVDADVLNWRRARAIEQPWRTQERLMVLIGASADSLRLVRLGKRLAGPGQAPWIVAHVSRSRDGAEALDACLAEAFKLAEELGAQTMLLNGQDLVAEILAAATEHNVTQIVVGRSRNRLRTFALQRSLASDLVRRAADLDVIVAAAGEGREERGVRLSNRSNWARAGWRAYAEAAAVTGACAAIALLLDPLLETANLGLVFLIGVLFAAVRGGVGPALFSSALSFLVFNYLLTEPRYTFNISSRRDTLTVVFYLVVALVTGQLAARVRVQIETIRANNRRIASLENFSRRLTGIVGRDDLGWVLVEYLRSTLALDAIVLMPGVDGKLAVAAGDPGRDGLTDGEKTAADWARHHKETAGRGTGTLPNCAWQFLPVLGRDATLAVLGVRPIDGRRALDPEQQRLLVAMRNQAGTALEKLQLATEMQRTRLLTETDKLRSSLLSSVSHDLRTPLVSIKGATTALLDLPGSLSEEDKHELLENVLEETDRLNRYVQNLIDMTRLGYGAISPRRDWCDVRDIVGAATRALKGSLKGHIVTPTIRAADELVHTDAALLGQVLVNLLDNAAKYSPPDGPIEIEARREAQDYFLTVCDHGAGIPVNERENVFDLFHRARAADQQPAGAGMGLAICKGLVESLAGDISISSRLGETGACITIRLPQPRQLPPSRERSE